MKQLRTILFIVIIIILFGSTNVYAKNYAGRFYEEGWQTSKVGVFAKEKGGMLDYNGWYVRSTKDKNIYYCIEPNTTLEGAKEKSHTIITDKTKMIKNSKLTNSKYKKVTLLAYYGYGYKHGNINHKNKKWYGITQVMIWRVMRSDLSWTFKTSRYGNASSSLYKKEVKEMNDLVNNHSKKPSFAASSKKISLGDSITIKDTNNVLEYYDIISTNSKIKAIKSGNELKITGIKNGAENITFKKNCNLNNNIELFTSKTYQDLIKKGSLEDITFNMKIEVATNNLTIQKEDSETGTKSQNGLSFKDATYEVFNDDNKKMGTLKTNDKGIAQIDLPNGTYTIKEIKAPIGYSINKKDVKVTINNKNEHIVLKDELIRGNLVIEKEKGSKTEGFSKEKGAAFEIYDSSNKLVDTLITDENGKTKISLKYGKYKIKQTKGIKGYSLISDFEVNIEEQKDYNYYLKNEKYSKLVFTKTDFSTKKPIPNTLIEIYTNNDKLVFKGRTNNKGKVEIEKIEIGKYYILEKDAPKYYLLNNEKMPFEVKENGEIIKCNMENHRKTGKLVITKIDSLEKTKLPGAKIDVIFKENNEKVYSGNTNNSGKIEIDNLIAGKYCIYEVKAPRGYKGIKKPICLEIDRQNEVKEIDIENTKNLTIPDTFLRENKQKLLIFISISLIGVSFIVHETIKDKKKI